MRPLLAGLAASVVLLAPVATQGAEDAAVAPPPALPAPAAAPIVSEPAPLTPELVAAALVPDFTLKATLYHAGAAGVGNKDSIGCRPVAMRTVATDPRLIPRRTILFIAETVGLPLPGGGVHDGFWYASDVGGAIKGERIDLYTGHGRASMRPVMQLNLKRLTVARAGDFKGCPKADSENHAEMLVEIAARSGLEQPLLAAKAPPYKILGPQSEPVVP